MWRDIDSLRRQNALSRQQNEELRKENEAIKRETEQIDQEIEIIDQEIEQIDRETEQIEQETAILRRQNKALAFLESRDFDKMIRELAGPGDGDARHPLDRVDVCLLCEKLVEHGCDERDLPFLLDALDLEIPKGTSQTSNYSPSKRELPVSMGNQQLPKMSASQLLIANPNKLSSESADVKPEVVSSFTNAAALYSMVSEDPELTISLFKQALRDPNGAIYRIVQLGSEQGLVVTANQLKDYFRAYELSEDASVILPCE